MGRFSRSTTHALFSSSREKPSDSNTRSSSSRGSLHDAGILREMPFWRCSMSPAACTSLLAVSARSCARPSTFRLSTSPSRTIPDLIPTLTSRTRPVTSTTIAPRIAFCMPPPRLPSAEVAGAERESAASTDPEVFAPAASVRVVNSATMTPPEVSCRLSSAGLSNGGDTSGFTASLSEGTAVRMSHTALPFMSFAKRSG
mmetsp:Transcript_1011/g.2911  ORF Transcript_1011/g.2911 Transcript_1011/m.2911 type:complete len:200 (-) Transcript_1011:268-867(-)